MASLGILAAGVVVYLVEAWSSPQGARGGSALGLMFGVVGFGFMLYAAALGARKRVPTWRLGRAKAWMRGHLWLGMLALPMRAEGQSGLSCATIRPPNSRTATLNKRSGASGVMLGAS